MKIVILGAFGQLGSHLSKIFSSQQTTNLYQVHKLDKDDFNFFNIEDDSISQLKAIKPEVIINCSAYTQVDKAETEVELAYQINAYSLKKLSTIANHLNAKLFHISTDFVFNGTATRPYLENDPCDPVSVYGKSKLLGEEIIREECHQYSIIRTSWLYSKSHPSFFTTMLRLSQSHEQINVVSDQIGSPTTAHSLAQAIVDLVKIPHQTNEVLHFSNQGEVSWHGFAQTIFSLTNNSTTVNPIPSSEYPTPARRPSYSVLNKSKIKKLGINVPSWQEALKHEVQS